MFFFNVVCSISEKHALIIYIFKKINKQGYNKLNPIGTMLCVFVAIPSVKICLELIPSHGASVVIGGGVFGDNPSLQCQPSHRKVVAKQRTSVENLFDPVIGHLVLRGSEDQIFKSRKRKDRKRLRQRQQERFLDWISWHGNVSTITQISLSIAQNICQIIIIEY